MSSPFIAIEFRPRRRGRGPVVASFVLLLATSAVPADAQQRIDVKVRASRAEASDSSHAQLRRLQRTLDSLTRVYNESENLSSSDRRRIEAGLTVTVARLEELVDRMNDPVQRVPRPDDIVRLRMAPGMAERAASAMSREMMQIREMEAAMPRGWIGINTQGAGTLPRVEDGQWIVRYYSYPRIVSVEPRSPAEVAGLLPNDTLLAYNGSDVRDNEISLTRLLRPSARVVVRVRRDGRVRDIPVMVASAPSRIAQRRDEEVREGQEPWLVAGVPEGAMFPRTSSSMPAGGGTRVMTRVTPPPMTVTGVPSAAMAPLPPRPGLTFSITMGGVAGAQLNTLTEGLARAIGVSAGVLVTSAPAGSLAYEAGMMDGDVITKVSGQSVRSVAQVFELLRLAFEMNGDRSVDVEMLRQKRLVKIQLKR